MFSVVRVFAFFLLSLSVLVCFKKPSRESREDLGGDLLHNQALISFRILLGSFWGNFLEILCYSCCFLRYVPRNLDGLKFGSVICF